MTDNSKAEKNKKERPLPRWTPASLLAVAFPLGMLPKAPGTWGSLAGIPLAFGIVAAAEAFEPYRRLVILSLLILFGLFSYWVIARTEKEWQTHDDGRIVIDEVLGQAMVTSFFPFDPFHLIAGFLLFRLFDIWKPWLVGMADRNLPGAMGTLLDDVVAGIFALFILLPLSVLIGYAAP